MSALCITRSLLTPRIILPDHQFFPKFAVVFAPLIGPVIGLWQEIAIQKECKKNKDNLPKVIELIELKNEYKGWSIFSDLLFSALTIHKMALGAITALNLGIVALLLGLAVIHTYCLIKNQGTLQEFRTTGPQGDISSKIW